MSELSQNKLKEFLDYSPETGIFTWAISNGSANAGNVAGWTEIDNYVRISINDRTYLAHRLAWFYVHGEWPEFSDHINHIRNDNRMINLRSVTAQENQRNKSLPKNNTSGVCGVSWFKRYEKWRASIVINSKYMYLGYFADRFEAICSRKSAESKYNFHENHGR